LRADIERTGKIQTEGVNFPDKSQIQISDFKINNRTAEPRGMLFSQGIGLGFNTFITAAEPQGINPSPRINAYFFKEPFMKEN
jgi:hypothetical protein